MVGEEGTIIIIIIIIVIPSRRPWSGAHRAAYQLKYRALRDSPIW
jgi:hypothetical protein